MLQKVKNYLKDVKTEMSKVSWPSKDELIESTVIVIILSIVLALFIFDYDFSISDLYSLLSAQKMRGWWSPILLILNFGLIALGLFLYKKKD